MFLFAPRRLTAIAFVFCAGAVGAAAETAPLNLEQAVQQALAKNYSLRISQLDTPIAQAQVTAAWGAFDPALEVSYKYNEDASPVPSDPYGAARPPSSLVATDSYDGAVRGLLPLGTIYSIGANGQNYRGTFNRYTGQYYTFEGVTVEQPLLKNFGFGANLAQIRIAHADRSRSEAQYEQSIADTITDVIFAYQELHYANQVLQVALRSRELAAGLVTENEKHFKLGDRSEYDVISAQARVAQREEPILSAQRAVIDQANVLRALISDRRDASLLNLPIAIEAPGEPPARTVDAAKDFAYALANRPDFREAKLAVERDRLNRNLQSNQLLPEVNLVGSYGYNGFGSSWTSSRQDLQDHQRRSFSAGAVVRIPFTFAAQRGHFRSAKLQLQQTQLREELLEQQILIQVANASGQIETTQQRVIAATQARELAQRTLDAEIKKLRAGSSSTFVVLQQQEQLAFVEVSEYRARTDAQRAIAEYDRELGKTLQRWNVHLINSGTAGTKMR